jgi:hypothetical protein
MFSIITKSVFGLPARPPLSSSNRNARAPRRQAKNALRYQYLKEGGSGTKRAAEQTYQPVASKPILPQ